MLPGVFGCTLSLIYLSRLQTGEKVTDEFSVLKGPRFRIGQEKERVGKGYGGPEVGTRQFAGGFRYRRKGEETL